jgi:hypothetical protein
MIVSVLLDQMLKKWSTTPNDLTSYQQSIYQIKADLSTVMTVFYALVIIREFISTSGLMTQYFLRVA